VKELEVMALLSLVLLGMGLVTQRQGFFYGALVLLASALFVPPLARAMTGTWLKLSVLLGTVSNRVILAAVFYLLLTPLALLSRRFTRNPLMLRREDGADSFFSERNHTYDKADMERMW
jgi:hypothetical protein